MKHAVTGFCIILLSLLVACGGGEAPEEEPQEQRVTPRGSLGFWFHVEEDYYNGVEPRGNLVMLAEIPDIMSIVLDTPSIEAAAAAAAFAGGKKDQEQTEKKPPSSIVNLEFKWLGDNGSNFFLHLDRLPGPAWYYLAYRWDCENGIFDGFLNGVPLRAPGAKLAAWEIAEQVVKFQLDDTVEDFEISNNFWAMSKIKSILAKREHIDMGPRIGYADKTPMENVEQLKGKHLFAPDFSKKGVLDDWKMEGPGVIKPGADGWLYMESSEIDVGGPGDGHFVFWPPQVFPSDFIAEWEFQPQSDDGLCIVLFAAQGQNGEHLFDPALKKRDGHFGGYIRGDISCYHISYFANPPTNRGRTTSNMRKNHGFYLVTNGPAGVAAGSRDVHKVTLVKQGGRVRLGVDGDSIIDWTDDGVQYGPVWGGGQIGLRQMKWMKAQYRNFKVWEIKK